MEEQLTPSTPAPAPIPSTVANITPEALEQMKARAREGAIRTAMLQRQPSLGAPTQNAPVFQPQPQVVYLRRNLTVAELILTIFLACGIVVGVQTAWNFGTKFLPRIEVKIK
jgi:hypothetical protein